jgi:hypothetical protein
VEERREKKERREKRERRGEESKKESEGERRGERKDLIILPENWFVSFQVILKNIRCGRGNEE